MEGRPLAYYACLKEAARRAGLDAAATSCIPLGGTGAGAAPPPCEHGTGASVCAALQEEHRAASRPSAPFLEAQAMACCHRGPLLAGCARVSDLLQGTGALLPVSHGGELHEMGTGCMAPSDIAPWSPLPHELGAGLSPAVSAQSPVHTRMLNVVLLS